MQASRRKQMSLPDRASQALLYRMGRTWMVVASVLLSAAPVHAQQDSGTFEVNAISNWRPEHYLVAAFCLLGFIVVILQFILFLRARDRITATDIMRSFSTTLILIAVVALLGIGYNAAQVQPAIALFGTLLGYLMGRGEVSGAARADAAPRHDSVQPSSETSTERQS